MHSKLRRWPGLALAALAVTVSTVFLAVPAAFATDGPDDVYIRDNAGDVGNTPTAGPDIYWSPDVVVCPDNPAPCGTDVPVTPGQNYEVFVTLHRNNPTKLPLPPTSGQLRLYEASAGGAANWNPSPTPPPDPAPMPLTWSPTGAPLSVTMTGDTMQIGIHWHAPSPKGALDHYCLLAVWSSPNDPEVMPIGQDLDTIIRGNNNVAQHNVVMAEGAVGQGLRLPFTVRDPKREPVRAGIDIVPLGKPFVGPGSLIVDLGPALGPLWLKSGALGTGVTRLGDGYQVQVTDPNKAQLYGFPLNPGDQYQLWLTFLPGSAASGGQYVENVHQTDSQGQVDGGVQYRIAVS